MHLGIRTDNPTAELTLQTESGETIEVYRWEAGRQLSDQLLEAIKALLQRHGRSWSDVKGLVVFRGPGSFTGLRIGATVANAIAYARDLPIVGTSGQAWMTEGGQKLRLGQNDVQAIPLYGSEPNITHPGQRSEPSNQA
jgi:tRNA threonylcarbamoyladenosine biosynthesis protein TsaB